MNGYRLISIALLEVLLSMGLAFAETVKGEVIASVVEGKPELRENIAYVNPADKGGLSWRWTEKLGRRDVGQHFRVQQSLQATHLAVQINSAGNSQQYDCPFRLIFGRQGVVPAPIDEIAVFEGRVPERGQAPRSGKWLVLNFPALTLEPGDYCFVLQFTGSGMEGQSLVFNVAAKADAYPEGKGFWSSPGAPETYVIGLPLNFILSDGVATNH